MLFAFEPKPKSIPHLKSVVRPATSCAPLQLLP